MVQAISAIGNRNPYNDPEYMKIIQELLQLGLAPTGSKQIDKGRLETEKQKLAQKIEEKVQEQNVSSQNTGIAERSQMEVQKLGAMTVAELNKILHGLA